MEWNLDGMEFGRNGNWKKANLATAQMSAQVCSVALIVLPPGVL